MSGSATKKNDGCLLKRRDKPANTTTPGRQRTMKQLKLDMENQEKHYIEQYDKMRMSYEQKLCKFNSMEIRYMASRQHQETLLGKVKKLEVELAEGKKQLAEEELTKIRRGSVDVVNESVPIMSLGTERELREIKDRCERSENDLMYANEVITQRDSSIGEVEKRVEALRQSIREFASDLKNGSSVCSQPSTERPSQKIDRHDEDSDSDREMSPLVIVIDDEDDGEVQEVEAGPSKTVASLRSKYRPQALRAQKRQKAIIRNLDSICQTLQTMQTNVLSTSSELKSKSTACNDLQKRVEKLQVANLKLKGECDDLHKLAFDKPDSAMKALGDQLRDLEDVSGSAVKSFEQSSIAFERIDSRRNEYKSIISSSIGDIDKLCDTFRQYLSDNHSKPDLVAGQQNDGGKIKDHCSTPSKLKNQCSTPSKIKEHGHSEKKSHFNGTPKSRSCSIGRANHDSDQRKSAPSPSGIAKSVGKTAQMAESLTVLRENQQSTLKYDEISKVLITRNPSTSEGVKLTDLRGTESTGAEEAQGANVDASFSSDCSIITLDKTRYVEMEKILEPEIFKKPLQPVQYPSSNSPSRPKQKHRGQEWLMAKRPRPTE